MTAKGQSVIAVVLAAGSGKRMGGTKNKILLQLNKIPIIYRTLFRMSQIELVDSIILVCRKSDIAELDGMFRRYGKINKLKDTVIGGKERSDSVRIGLRRVMDSGEQGIVMTHDGARPFFSEDLIKRLITETTLDTISIPALPIFDTVRMLKDTGVTNIVDRSRLYVVQTPQVFSISRIKSCFFDKSQLDLDLTDEASYFESVGQRVNLVEGEKWNIKLTSPADLDWAESLILKTKILQLKGFDI